MPAGGGAAAGFVQAGRSGFVPAGGGAAVPAGGGAAVAGGVGAMACMLLRCSVKLVMLLAANRNRATLVLGIRGLH